MSTNFSIFCDECGNELTTKSQYPHKWALELRSIDVNVNKTGVAYCVDIKPELSSTVHFCGLSCLGDWLKGRS